LLAFCAACYSGVPSSGGQDGDGGGADSDGHGEPQRPAEFCREHPLVGSDQLRRLTREQYENTIEDLLGVATEVTASFLPDDRVGAFATNSSVPITELAIENYQAAAEDIASQAVPNASVLVPCDAASNAGACAQTFIESWGARAFRRPLEDVEIERLLSVYETGAASDGFEGGLSLIIQAVLQSPNFLYLLEYGDGVVTGGEGEEVALLTNYELATRLSYLLWNTMPDDALFEAAAAGDLIEVEGLQEQAFRMLEDERATAGWVSFHRQWLGLDQLESTEKDPQYFTGFDDAMREAMVEETARFVRWVFSEGDGRLETLLTADFGFPTGPLFELYGIDPTEADADGMVRFPDGERSGLLTQAGVMSVLAHRNRTSPVHRGLMVREQLFCQDLPPPPPGVNDTLPEPEPNQSEQDVLREHRENPECSGCHTLIDPIGFTLERYDAVGRYRTSVGTVPIDASGELVGTDVDGPIETVPQLAEKLAQSEQVQACLADQWFKFGLGRMPHGEDDQCSTAAVAAALENSDGDVRELVAALVTSDAFRFRRVEP
jgi:hypothetical protein